MISSGTSGMLSDSDSILRVHWSVCVCKGWSGLARRSVWDHLAWLAYMWQVTGAGVMKANLRPVDRMPCVGVGGGGTESGSWFLAKPKHQEDNCRERKLLAPPSFHSFS